MGYEGNSSRIPGSRKFLLFFMTGFVAGVLFSNLLGRQYADYAGLLSEYYLNRYKYMEIVREQLFFYLLRERMVPVLFLLLLSLTSCGRAAVYLFLAWQGFSFGTLLTISILKFAGKGILLCATGMLPQYLFYVPAFLMLAEHICRASGYELIRSRSFGRGGKGILVGNMVLYFVIFFFWWQESRWKPG